MLMSYKMTKKKSDINYADEVQEITAAKTPMKKNKHVCVTCNKTLEDYTEICWHYCGKTLGNKKEVNNHILEACEPISSENYNEHIAVQKKE